MSLKGAVCLRESFGGHQCGELKNLETVGRSGRGEQGENPGACTFQRLGQWKPEGYPVFG